MNLNIKALRETAADQPCQFNVPGVCLRTTSTTVWCHSNESRHGKGRGIKAHDVFGAWGCRACHDWYDNGTATREDKAAAFRAAMEATYLQLFSRGLVTVAKASKRPVEPSYKPLSKILPRTRNADQGR